LFTTRPGRTIGGSSRQTDPVDPVTPRPVDLDDPAPLLLATDLDGTFLDRDGRVADRTRASLRRALDAGVHVVFVTGRPPRWIHEVAVAADHHELAICANGAAVVDLVTETVISTTPLPVDVAREVAERLRVIEPTLGFAVEVSTVGQPLPGSPRAQQIRDSGAALLPDFAHDESYRPLWPGADPIPVMPLADLLAQDNVIKLLAKTPRREGLDADVLLERALEAVDGLLEVTHSSHHDILLEFSATGVTKGSTLERLAADRGWEAAHVAAVGDMPNDLPMLAWAGSPYAVANAHPSLLDLVPAHRHLAAHDEHGVADLLDALASAARHAR